MRHACVLVSVMLQISETKEEGVVHLPHIEISRKWRENEELDLHDANVIRPARACPTISHHGHRHRQGADGGSVFSRRAGRTERGPTLEEKRTDAVHACGDTDRDMQRGHASSSRPGPNKPDDTAS